MPSKWAFLKTHYPALPPEARYREAVETHKREFADAELATLGHRCNDLEADLAALETREAEVRLKIQAIEELISDRMEQGSLDSVVMAGYRWSTAYEPHPVVADKHQLREWAMTHMPDNLSLQWSTLKGIVRDALDADSGSFELPPGVDVYVKRGFRRTKQ